MRSASASPLNRQVPAAEPADAIVDGELDAIFAAVEAASRVALAVSGGPDSFALLDCFDRWRRKRGRPEGIVLSVDHRLRAGSAEEAAAVARAAAARGLPVRILVWEGPRPESAVEAAARLARYRLMLTATREAGASHLLLAHHRDDQAETFLMRLAAGSGVFGLAAMRRVVSVGDVTIVRPFLDFPSARLVATTAAAGLRPVEDPMNADPRFLRARLRRIMPLLAENGLNPAEIAAAAGRLAGAADALEAAAERVIAAAVQFDGLAIGWLDQAMLFDEPGEVRRRVLTRLLQAIGGEPYPPRTAKLEAIDDAMGRIGGRFKRTLAGTVIERRGFGYALYRETGRVGLPGLPAKGPSRFVWDHRFEITIGEGMPPDVMVGALGEDGRREIKAFKPGAPAGAIAALPAFRRAQEIVAVPSLSWRHAGADGFAIAARPLVAERSMAPLRFPDAG
jgi:tRNA(Ile)-lysidine synthase